VDVPRVPTAPRGDNPEGRVRPRRRSPAAAAATVPAHHTETHWDW